MGKDDGDERRREDITLSSLLPTTISTTSGDTSSQAPLTIVGAPRTIRDSTHRILNAYHTRAGAHAQEGRTEMIPCVSHEEEKRSAVNTRTEYNSLCSAVIRCGDGSQTFLACIVLQYEHVVQRKASQRLSFPTRGRKHIDAPVYSS